MQTKPNQITITLHLQKLQRIDQKVDPALPISSLRIKYPHLDFYHKSLKLPLEKSFQDCGMTYGGEIHTYQIARQMWAMDISFKLLDESVITLNVSPVTTFGQCIEQIAEFKQIPKELMRLVFAGRLLQPEMAFMDESGMQKETTLHVIVRGQK